MSSQLPTVTKYSNQISLSILFLSLSLFCISTSAQSSKPSSNTEISNDRNTEGKSLNKTKTDANELTYVANADNCLVKAMNLPIDHGPRATSNTWLNNQRISECFSRVR